MTYKRDRNIFFSYVIQSPIILYLCNNCRCFTNYCRYNNGEYNTGNNKKNNRTSGSCGRRRFYCQMSKVKSTVS